MNINERDDILGGVNHVECVFDYFNNLFLKAKWTR
jgi:hypothetical protein